MGDSHKPRESVERFAREMERVLQANDHKGGWQDMTPLELLDSLTDEWVELSNAVDAGAMRATAEEAIDVANFAMMLYEQALRHV